MILMFRAACIGELPAAGLGLSVACHELQAACRQLRAACPDSRAAFVCQPLGPDGPKVKKPPRFDQKSSTPKASRVERGAIVVDAEKKGRGDEVNVGLYFFFLSNPLARVKRPDDGVVKKRKQPQPQQRKERRR